MVLTCGEHVANIGTKNLLCVGVSESLLCRPLYSTLLTSLATGGTGYQVQRVSGATGTRVWYDGTVSGYVLVDVRMWGVCEAVRL